MAIKILMIINFSVLIFLILLSTGYVILLISSIRDVFTRYTEITQGDELSLIKTHAMIPVTAIVACYNEENSIINTVESILKNTYKNKYIIVVNDGSTDHTMQILTEMYDLHKTDIAIPNLIKTHGELKAYYLSKKHSNLVVLDKEHYDKGDSLNVGLNACRTPVFLTIDADTVLESNALSEIVFYAITKPHLVCVGGAVYIANGCKIENGNITSARISTRIIPALQSIEYLRSFLFNRAGLNIFGGSLSLSGAFTLFDYKSVLDINGFDVDNPANDFEIVTHLQANAIKTDPPSQIGYTPAPTAWTDVPETLKDYWKQRYNWQIGSLRSILLHNHLLFNTRYGWVGMFLYPLFLFGEVLGCFIELAAYLSIFFSWYLGILNFKAAVMFFVICWLFVCILTMTSTLMYAITYNKYGRLFDMPYVFLLVTIESFGFRQYHMICKVLATLSFIFKKKKHPAET